MKPSTLIILIISAVLIIAGLILLLSGSSMAKKQNINLFRADNEKNEQGLNFEVREIDNDTEKIIINIKSDKPANINIIGSAEKSYVEIINFPKNQFEYSNSNKELKISKTGAISDYFSINTIKDNAFDQWGLRYFIKNNVSKDDPYTINLYLANNSAFTSLQINCKSGNISIENNSLMTMKYDLSLESGKIELARVNSNADLTVNISNNGDIILTDCSIDDQKITIEKGNATAYINKQYNLNSLKTEKGAIVTSLNGSQPTPFTKEHSGVFPSPDEIGTADKGVLPQLTVTIKNEGNISVFYGYTQNAEETAPEEAGTEDGTDQGQADEAA